MLWLRPTQAKYQYSWYVQPVLTLLESWWPLSRLNLATLSRRLATLLALATGQRVQTLALIDLRNVRRHDTGYDVAIPAVIKTSLPGAPQPLLRLPDFPTSPRLCVPTTLTHYMSVTRSKRGTATKLFLATVPPHRPVGGETISRWIRATLQEAGIDASFTSHSTRLASTSAAYRCGVNLDVIHQTASWSAQSRVFARHYNRPLQPGSFAEAVLLPSGAPLGRSSGRHRLTTN